MKLYLSIFLILILTFLNCQGPFHDRRPNEFVFQGEKIKGIHLFARHQPETEEFERIKSLNINTIVLVPYFYQRGLNSDTIFTSARGGYEWSERDEGIEHIIEESIMQNMDVIIKPHLWPVNTEKGQWRESIWPDSLNWKSWSTSYARAILHYAELSEKYKLKTFCFGAELKKLALQKPEYWRTLISEIRQVYSGKLVYAANWYEEFEEIEFWEDLDYIGIQAYFPISKEDSLGLDFMKKKWMNYASRLEQISSKYNKPILFTELGYRSVEKAGIEPWAWDEHWRGGKNQELSSEKMQKECYQAFFETIWQKKWFAGVMIWNWKVPYDKFGGKASTTFSPQRKEAELTIRNYFSAN